MSPLPLGGEPPITMLSSGKEACVENKAVRAIGESGPAQKLGRDHGMYA
jgi:hypothetical protein